MRTHPLINLVQDLLDVVSHRVKLLAAGKHVQHLLFDDRRSEIIIIHVAVHDECFLRLVNVSLMSEIQSLNTVTSDQGPRQHVV